MVKPLQVLQWNVGKRHEAQLSLLNDQKTNDYDFLLLAEPFRFTPKGQSRPRVPQHHYWEAVLPTTFTETIYQPFNFQSMIYINKRFKYQQIPIPDSDLTAVTVTHRQDTLLIVSAYIEYHQNATQCKKALERRLQLIGATFQKVQQKNPKAQLVVAGDFNRHDTLWGGTRVHTNRQGEAEPILQFLMEHQLCSVLPQGTTTYQGSGHESTIDLMLIPSLLQPAVESCQIHEVDHGSDHKAIALKLRLEGQAWKIPLQRRSYNMADWEDIRTTAQERIGPPPCIASTSDLDNAAQRLENQVQELLQEKIPPPKAFPYAKRWWSRELTNLRREYNHWRNQWTAAKRKGEYNPALYATMVKANRVYLAQIAKQKKNHWIGFLDDHQNVWKALAYLKNSGKSWTLPALKAEGCTHEEDEDKARVLIQTFFPPQPEPQGGQTTEGNLKEAEAGDPIGDRLLEGEVEKAIFSSNPRKAPGPGDISFQVWQELWPVVKHWVVHIYRRSIQLGHIPKSWTEAKIIVIPKPGKPDYTIPKAYRPISLLCTISKGLEKVVAQRLSEYLERTEQLPCTQFGARPRRSTEQALTVLTEKIYDAWRKAKVLTLVTFDVQGAYNGVNKEVLQQRL